MNGTQYKDENDYAIIKETKSFKECGSYASSIEFKIDQNVIELDELNDDDFKKIKYNLYMEGPILAVLQSMPIIILIFIFNLRNYVLFF